ncbi:hypothetical protein B0A48_14032 [Cryoendolithus antarcticus]|uniref:C2H2-type domain-containing protein n=1 Tax=Cryoendolithus antarcticus TaxID=1507870 RepID=A0A1V8SM55_9PEZI|nr:hypothetical protein B0A48_14032 [Cryoendolithus antarcticus]
MAPYNANNQYGAYYDPVGSQANQTPTGYTYQSASTTGSQYPSATTPGSRANTGYQSSGSNNYSAGQCVTAPQQQHASVDSGSNRGSAGSLSTGQNYGQSTGSRSSSTQQSGNTGWSNADYGASTYQNRGTGLQMSNRTQSRTSPLNATNTPSTATFGRLSYPPTVQSQSSTSGYLHANTGSSYQTSSTQNTASTLNDSSYQSAYNTAPQSQAPTQPQRYATPLQAVQAQQHQSGHSKQASLGSGHQPSSLMNSHQPVHQVSHRQQSESVEPASTTVDPSQVYDFRAEREKKAKIEAEKQRKLDEEKTARKAEENRLVAERRKVEEIKQKAEDEAAKEAAEAKRKGDADAAAKKASQDRKNEQRRKAREETPQSATAATALTQMASSKAPVLEEPQMPDMPGATPEEIEMRMMFQKLREFNAKNPTMLAKLWEEERRSHGASQSPQQAKSTVAPLYRPATAKAPTTAAPASSAAALSTPSAAPTAESASAMITAFKPFSRPKPPPPAHLMGASATTKKPATSTLWPPGKKRVLAELAAKWLTGKNPDKPMTKADLLARLDQNPNYVELCESLENVGLKFERAGFAKQLLHAVPGGSSTKSPASTNGGGGEMNGGARTTPLSNTGKKRGRPTREEMQWRRDVGLIPRVASSSSNPITKPNGDTTVSYEVPSFSPSDAAREVNNMHRQPPSAPQDPLPGPARTAPSSSVSTPAPAVQSAFINTFVPPAVSNTPIYSFDDEPAPAPTAPEPKMEVKPTPPPRPPADKEEAARKRDFSTMVDLTQADSDDDELPPPKMQQTAQGVGIASQGSKASDVPLQAMTAQTLQCPGAPPVQIFRPPTPNGRFKAPPAPMAAQSIAQPAPPPPAPPMRTGPTQEFLQHERIRGKMIVEPIMRDRVARKSHYDDRTIARDVLLATGRHPDMRPLNAHMNHVQRLLGERGGMIDSGGNRSDLATIKWDVIDPEPAKESHSNAVGNLIRNEDAADADDEGDTLKTVHRINKTTEEPPLASVKEPGYIHKPKKKGRPSKTSKLSSVRADTSGGSTPQPTSTTRQPNTSSGTRKTSAPNRGAVSSPAMSGSGAAVGYAAFRQLDENGNVIKTKGRPKGWRKSVHSREAQGLPPAAAGSKPLSGAGRTAYRPPTQPLQEPKFQVYNCEWQGCKAELHSLSTLRKHIVKLHGRPGEDDEYACLWTKCNVSKGFGQPATFGQIEGWVKHVEKEHLEPIAWRLGDGPKSGLPGIETHDSDAYLSDSHGRSITPIIQPFSAVNLTPATSIDTSGLNEQARDAVRRLEARKRIVGPTMGQLGCKFVNQKRRLGFLDDEDFEDEVAVEGETGSESEGEGMEGVET